MLHTKESIEWSSEIEKLFLAIYFMMENSQANEYREFYNDKLIQTIMIQKELRKEDHPLNAQKNNLFIWNVKYSNCRWESSIIAH